MTSRASSQVVSPRALLSSDFTYMATFICVKTTEKVPEPDSRINCALCFCRMRSDRGGDRDRYGGRDRDDHRGRDRRDDRGREDERRGPNRGGRGDDSRRESDRGDRRRDDRDSRAERPAAEEPAEPPAPVRHPYKPLLLHAAWLCSPDFRPIAACSCQPTQSLHESNRI